MNRILCFAVVFSCKAVFAQVAAPALPPPPPQLNPASPDATGKLVIVEPRQLPVPPPPGQLGVPGPNAPKAEDDFSPIIKSDEVVQQFINEVAIAKAIRTTPEEAAALMKRIQAGKPGPEAPVLVGSMDHLRVGFPVAATRTGKFLGATPSGTVVKGAWTGVSRFFQIDGAGTYKLEESDMAASQGAYYLLKGADNAKIGGTPAASLVFVDEGGRRVEKVLWARGHMLYSLIFAPDMQRGRYAPMKANANISAYSLASEIR